MGILRGVQQEGRERRRLERRNAKARRDDRRREREYLAEIEALEQNPQARTERGLRLIRLQWDEANQELLQGGSGIGRIDLREGLGTLRERAGPLFFKPAPDLLGSMAAHRTEAVSSWSPSGAARLGFCDRVRKNLTRGLGVCA